MEFHSFLMSFFLCQPVIYQVKIWFNAGFQSLHYLFSSVSTDNHLFRFGGVDLFAIEDLFYRHIFSFFYYWIGWVISLSYSPKTSAKIHLHDF